MVLGPLCSFTDLSCIFFFFLNSGWMPAPVYFGATIDSTCLLWAGPVGAKGACKVYDNLAFRRRYIGLISGLQSLGTLLMIALLILLLRKPSRWTIESTKTTLKLWQNWRSEWLTLTFIGGLIRQWNVRKAIDNALITTQKRCSVTRTLSSISDSKVATRLWMMSEKITWLARAVITLINQRPSSGGFCFDFFHIDLLMRFTFYISAHPK